MTDNVAFVAPDHITKDVLQKSVRKGLNDDSITVTNFTVAAGSKPGDNYTSAIYRVQVTYNNATSKDNLINLVIKSLSINAASSTLENLGFLDLEINVYLEVLPELQKILGTTKVAPICYDVFFEPHRNIVFEDLKADDYVCADREIGLDEEHLALALQRIAKFHAASLELLNKKPETAAKYNSGIFSEKSIEIPIFEALFRNNLKLGAQITNKTPGYERFSEKLLKLYEHFHDIALKSTANDRDDDFKVLNHGDLWVNNFLYKYDEESKKPVDIVFVDYQGTHVNSVGLDLNYLFIASANLQTLPRKAEFVVKYYYPALVAEMKRLNLNSIPPLSKILQQLESREMFTILCLFAVLPLVSMDKEEAKTNSFDQFANEELSKHKTLIGMSSKRFIGSMTYTLDYLEKTLDDTLKNY